VRRPVTNFPFEYPVKRVTLDANGVAELLASFEDLWASRHGERITSAEFYARYSAGQMDSQFAMAWASYYEGHCRMTGADTKVDRLASSR